MTFNMQLRGTFRNAVLSGIVRHGFLEPVCCYHRAKSSHVVVTNRLIWVLLKNDDAISETFSRSVSAFHRWLFFPAFLALGEASIPKSRMNRQKRFFFFGLKVDSLKNIQILNSHAFWGYILLFWPKNNKIKCPN